VTWTPLSQSKGQGHQAALLSAALTLKAAAAVSVGTYSAWESTATLRLLGGARGGGAPTGEERGGAYCIATRTACLELLSRISFENFCAFIEVYLQSKTASAIKRFLFGRLWNQT